MGMNCIERIQTHCHSHKPKPIAKGEHKLADDALPPLYWKQLDELHTALERYFAAIQVTEAFKAPFYRYTAILDQLLAEIEEQKDLQAKKRKKDPSYEWLSSATQCSWEKADKYFKLTDDASITCVAILHIPTPGDRWFYDKRGSHAEKATWIEIPSKQC